MNNALRNTISRPSLRAAVDSIDPVIASYAASSARPVQPGHCYDFVAASSQYIDTLAGITGGTAVDISFTINPDLLPSAEGLFGCGGINALSKGITCVSSSGALSVSYGDGTTTDGQGFAGITLVIGTWYECRFVWDGGASIPTLTVNGVDFFTPLAIFGWAGASTDNLTFSNNGAGIISYFDGKLGPCKYDGVLQYNNDYSTGTTAIDSSGNSNDGTFVNGPTATTSSSLPFSWLNQVGFTDNAGLLVPRDESDPTNDAQGNPLQYSGNVFPRRPIYRDSYAGLFDMSDDHIRLVDDSYNAESSGCVEVELQTGSDVTTNQNIFGYGSSTVGSQLQEFRIIAGNVGSSDGGNVIRGTSTLLPNTDYTLKWLSTGSAYEFYINGNLESLVVVSGSNGGSWFDSITSGVTRYAIAARPKTSGIASPFGGIITKVTIRDDSDVIGQWTISEGVGPTSHDVSGNENDGTITNSSTGTEGAGFWAGRVDTEAEACNINNGFTLYENGGNKLRVPYVDGSPHPSPTIPGGYTLTSENPAVTNGYNDAETTLDIYKIAVGDTVAPETDHLSNFEEVVFSDTNYSLGTTSPVDTVFIRDDSSVAKGRLLGFSDTLTDVPLVYANNFTHGERWNDLAPWEDPTFWNE